MRAYHVAAILLVASVVWAAAVSEAATCGDADGSGGLAINDVVRHLRVVSGIDPAAALCGGAGYADCGDLNGDGAGSTDISDTVLLLRRATDVANCAPDVCLPHSTLAGCPGTATLPERITGSLVVPAGCDARLAGVTFVEAGGVLTVEPGVTVKAETDAWRPSMLIVKPGGRINAVGTSLQPITWTSAAAPGSRQKGDWVGLVLLGKAPVNVSDAYAGVVPEGNFGGTDPDDFTGCMSYNRISFAGRLIVPEYILEPHLVLAGIGRRTRLDHIHTHLGTEDCIVIFGGTVSLTHVIASACGYHGLLATLGWTGGMQFGLIAQRAADLWYGGANALELENRSENEPRTNGRFCNLTALGVRGAAENPGVTNQLGVRSERGNAMTIANAIIKDFLQAGYQMRHAETAVRACVDPATLNTTPPVGVIANSLFADNGADGTTHALNHSSCDTPGECACTTTEHFALLQAQRDVLATADQAVQAIGGHVFPPTDLVPPLGSLPATHPAADCTTIHPAFIDAPYIGAFAPGGEDWTAGWTDYPLN